MLQSPTSDEDQHAQEEDQDDREDGVDQGGPPKALHCHQHGKDLILHTPAGQHTPHNTHVKRRGGAQSQAQDCEVSWPAYENTFPDELAVGAGFSGIGSLGFDSRSELASNHTPMSTVCSAGDHKFGQRRQCW